MVLSTRRTFSLADREVPTGLVTSLIDLTFAQTAFQSVVCNNATVNACSVYGTDGEGIGVTFDDQAAQKIAAFAEDLSSTAPARSPVLRQRIPAVMTRRSATTVWVVWTEITSSPTHYLMRVGAYDTTAALSGGNVGYAWHLHPAFFAAWEGSANSLKLRVHTDDGSAAWAVQRRYTLATLSMDLDTPSAFGMFIEPELAPDERSNQQQSFHVPEVAFRSATDESGASQRAIPGLATIPSQQNDTVLGRGCTRGL